MTAETDLFAVPVIRDTVDLEEWRDACVSSATEALRAEVELLTHKVITCGVAAGHPDPNLTRTGAYASKWNSAQAQDVRALRDRAERLAEALREAYGQVRELCDCYGHVYPETSFARYEVLLHPTAAQEAGRE